MEPEKEEKVTGYSGGDYKMDQKTKCFLLRSGCSILIFFTTVATAFFMIREGNNPYIGFLGGSILIVIRESDMIEKMIDAGL
jgi:hypothetical protein